MSEAIVDARAIRVDVSHLLSKEQIEYIKSNVNKGDYISFLDGEDRVEGKVDKKYQHIFMLEDGRTFSWIKYITGSDEVLRRLKLYHPVTGFVQDETYNYYRMKMIRTD